MSWLRFGGCVAAVVLATSVAIACGDTTSITIVDTVDAGAEAGPDAADALAAVDGGTDSDVDGEADASDASSDAPYDGPGCSNDQSPVSDTCNFGSGSCPSDVCSLKPSLVVYCFKHSGTLDGGVRPPVDGCTYFGTVSGVGGAAEWCCPPACVPSSTNDANCAADHRFMYCPHDASDGGAIVTPPAACTQVTMSSPGEVQRGYCCPR